MEIRDNAQQTWLGNLLTMSSQNRWLREYFYTADGSNNYLLKHEENGNNLYYYDQHGKMLEMPHLSEMNWDYRDNINSYSLIHFPVSFV